MKTEQPGFHPQKEQKENTKYSALHYKEIVGPSINEVMEITSMYEEKRGWRGEMNQFYMI